MKTIAEQVALIRSKKKIGLMTHVVAGYPCMKDTEDLILRMAAAGVDCIEIQIPFSDPIADGPTIMRANDTALEHHVTTDDAFVLMETMSQKVEIPLLFMGYYNTVFHFGTNDFCRRAKEVGAQGLIIPDIPLDEEEHEGFVESCRANNLAHIRVLSPTSTTDRVERNVAIAEGFIYCTAVSGTTGTRESIDPNTRSFLEMMREKTALPLAVGFGISSPQHVQALIGLADIAVVGSAVIAAVERGGVDEAERLIQSLVAAGAKEKESQSHCKFRSSKYHEMNEKSNHN